jgi:hypothetical protein
VSSKEHDPEKWKPVFGKDHAQANQRIALLIAIWCIAAKKRLILAQRDPNLQKAHG